MVPRRPSSGRTWHKRVRRWVANLRQRRRHLGDGGSLHTFVPCADAYREQWLGRTAYALIQCAACRSTGARLMSSVCDSMCALTIASAAAMASASPFR